MYKSFATLLVLVLLTAQTMAAQNSDDLWQQDGFQPGTLDQLINGTVDAAPVVKDPEEAEIQSSEIRKEALREAALSYGARGGLARRTAEIRESLKQHAGNLDQIYDFKRLLIPAPSGLMIEPPIISEGQNAAIIENGGQLAAVADRIYNINRNARIVSSPRNWRAYLEREWGTITAPPAILLPRTPEEQYEWVKNITTGWSEGTAQADEIFQADLNKLIADYTGMIRYRKLLAQGIVSAPFALQIDRGVTGGGSEMRVGDSAVQITGQSELQTGAFEWQPVPR